MGQRTLLLQLPNLSGQQKPYASLEPLRLSPGTARRPDTLKTHGLAAKPGYLASPLAHSPTQRIYGQGSENVIDEQTNLVTISEGYEDVDAGTDIISGYNKPAHGGWIPTGVCTRDVGEVTRVVERSLGLGGRTPTQIGVSIDGAVFDDLVAACEQQLNDDEGWAIPNGEGIDIGLLTKDSVKANARELELGKLKMKSLRALCRSYGLLLKGAKSDLIERIAGYELRVHQIPMPNQGKPLSDVLWNLPKTVPAESPAAV